MIINIIFCLDQIYTSINFEGILIQSEKVILEIVTNRPRYLYCNLNWAKRNRSINFEEKVTLLT